MLSGLSRADDLWSGVDIMFRITALSGLSRGGGLWSGVDIMFRITALSGLSRGGGLWSGVDIMFRITVLSGLSRGVASQKGFLSIPVVCLLSLAAMLAGEMQQVDIPDLDADADVDSSIDGAEAMEMQDDSVVTFSRHTGT